MHNSESHRWLYPSSGIAFSLRGGGPALPGPLFASRVFSEDIPRMQFSQREPPPRQPPTVRKEFPETWVWDSSKTDSRFVKSHIYTYSYVYDGSNIGQIIKINVRNVHCA